MLQKAFGETKRESDWSKIGMFLMILLYNSIHKVKLLSVFKNSNNKNEIILTKDNFGDINIFGDKYIMVKRCDINHVK